ncbi:MAG: flippase-like domain-containing protein [Anaerolineae bacterium]|nr:flippase-like domain-containing protein [Anaerolineae bacterium]
MELFQKHRRKIFGSVLLAIVVYAVLLLVADASSLAAELRSFEWELLPIIVALTVFNYGLRFVKWHWYLGVVGVKDLHWFDSLLIFLAGFSMTLTPGKAGEFLKAFLVRQRVGTPVATTSPIILAERMTDGLALLILAGAGFLIFDSVQVRIVMLGVVVAAAFVVLLVQRRELANRVMTWMERAPMLAARMNHVQSFYSSAYTLLKFKPLAIAIFLGVVSWAGECFALALILVGLGIPFSWTLVALSCFAMGFATLAGSLLLFPGGLGGAEASIGGLLIAFGKAPWLPVGTITPSIAAVATLMIRFATLWFGFFLGLVCLGIVQRRFGKGDPAAPQEAEAPAAAPVEGETQ